jgi:predicted regulator of Ras-like GTPase activity (Roadblock/LC7/MglB family)
MFPPMDANAAVAQLLEVSDDVHAAVVFECGEPVASNLPELEAEEIAGFADAMLAYAERLRKGAAVKQLEAVTPDGDVYVVREGERGVVAVAAPGSLAGVVQHDLRTVLGSLTRTGGTASANAPA